MRNVLVHDPTTIAPRDSPDRRATSHVCLEVSPSDVLSVANPSLLRRERRQPPDAKSSELDTQRRMPTVNASTSNSPRGSGSRHELRRDLRAVRVEMWSRALMIHESSPDPLSSKTL